MSVKILTKLRTILNAKSDLEIGGFKESLKKEYGFSNFLYLTNEGLPILGTFQDCEAVSAKVLELIKLLGQFNVSGYYVILTENVVYTLVIVHEDVIFFGEGTKIPKQRDIERLKLKTKKELNL